jgi:o-succinylbenzoate---CoA ligase
MFKLVRLGENTSNSSYEQACIFFEEWKSKSTAITQQTSGSTGKPKLIKIEKDAMVSSARLTGTFFQLDHQKTALLCISTDYIGGKMMLIRALEYGLELYCGPVSSNPLLDLNQTIDFCALVPYQVETILRESPEKLNLIKHLIIGGAPVNEKLEQQLKNYRCEAYSTFGMTETISHVALKKLNAANEPFKALGNTTFSKNDNDCLVINAPELCIDHLNTNDVIDLVDSKSFFWLGRFDNMINSGGVKLYPEEIERKLSPYLPEDSFIIVGIPDAQLGQKIGFLCLKNRYKYDELNMLFIEYLEKFERPREIIAVNEFIYTPTGKIKRKESLDHLKIER